MSTKRVSRNSQLDMLPLEDMYAYGDGDALSCIFDFAKIPYDDYRQFFNTLPNVIYKKCADIGFSTAAYSEFERTKRQDLRSIVKDSILVHKSNFTHYLTKILCKTIPMTKSMHSLSFEGISFSQDDISRLFEVLSKSRMIKNLEFKYVHIDDSNFIDLLSKISLFHFERLHFIGCDITSDSFDAVIEFLKTQPKNKTQRKTLIEFDLDENDFTDDEIQQIKNAFEGKAIDQPTLSDNSAKKLQAKTKKHGSETRKTVSDDQLAKQFLKSIQDVDTYDDEEDPYVLNEKLHAELAELMKRLPAIRIDDDTFLVGPGAEEALKLTRA